MQQKIGKPYVKKDIKVMKEVKITTSDNIDGPPISIRGRVERHNEDNISIYIDGDDALISNKVFSILREACLDAMEGCNEFMCPSFEAKAIHDNGELHLHLKLVEEYKELKIKQTQANYEDKNELGRM